MSGERELITTSNIDRDKLTPLMRQVYDIKRQYLDDIVLFRVGDFYEAYFEDAPLFSKLVGITLTAKLIGSKGNRISIPMAGIQHTTLNEYAMKVVSSDRRVVVVDQLEDPKSVKNGQLVKRGVVRIITCSTVVEDGYIDDYSNNYLSVVHKLDNEYGLCFGDISTGEIFMTYVDSIDGVLNELSRYKPNEILLDTECYLLFNNKIKTRLKYHVNITVKDEFFIPTNLIEKIEKSFDIDSIDKIKYNHISELYSLYALLSYIEFTQCIEVDYGSLPVSYETNNFMEFDIDTRRNLELTENIIDRKRNGTLLSVLDKTKTVMGSRMLKQWIEKPLVSKSKIEGRLEAVEDLLSNYEVTESIRLYLDSVFDISRIMGRLKLNRSVPRDLLTLRESLRQLPHIKVELGKLSSPFFVNMYNNFDTMEDLYFLLEKAICDDPVSDIKEGIVIKNGYSKDLDRAREMVHNSNKFLMELEEREKEKTGIRNLKVVNVRGVCTIEVTKANLDKVPSYYQIEQSLRNCTRFKTEESKKLEYDLLTSIEHSKSLEIELYEEVKALVLSKLTEVTRLCEILSILDVLCCFAYVSKINNYIKPKLNTDGDLVIRDSRHPIVEEVLKEEFVCNDVIMNMTSDRYLLITGPNMAGKSTYMRQVALIVIMAHIGCYVPASYANISITDKIFTRIGASDDISSGRSTYMVEMEEVCNILKNSTSKSLVLLDEVGRGTSTSDGLAIAQAITEYIHNSIGCKTLFATHYHELINLEKSLSGLSNYHMSVGRTEDNDLVFLRKIEKGGLSDSYGIDVAKLAGIPDEVVNRAWDILNRIEDKNIEVTTPIEDNEIIKELKNIDITELNPLNSYKYLNDLVKRVQNL